MVWRRTVPLFRKEQGWCTLPLCPQKKSCGANFFDPQCCHPFLDFILKTATESELLGNSSQQANRKNASSPAMLRYPHRQQTRVRTLAR